MRSDVKEAILKIYTKIEEAKKAQEMSGHTDQGGRQGITSGKHLDQVSSIIKADLISAGFKPEDILDKGKECELPGWFRPSKNWDILAFDGDSLVSAIELKTINSSFGNNANNRAEESIGSAFDVYTAFVEELLGSCSIPPVIGYVMIVRDCDSSRAKSKRVRSGHFPIDSVFHGVSYLERFTILCDRLRRKNLYQAVWLVFADPDSNKVYEPSPALTYEKFLANIVMALSIHRA